MPNSECLKRFLAQPDTALILFDTMPRFFYFIKDIEHRFVRVNQQLADKMGLSEAEIVGKTDYDFFPTQMADAYFKDDSYVLTEQTPIINKVELVPSHRGQTDWALTNKTPLIDPDGKAYAILGITRPFSSSTTAIHSSAELAEALTHIHTNFAEKISIPDLAKLSFLSVSAFERKFKKIFHSTPNQYLLHTRVQQACHMLTQSSESLAVIAESCGFYDQSHFCKAFAKTMNVSPLKYRKQYLISPS